MIQNKFKVIIPVYNSEQYITPCINSLKDQTYTNWNAMVIDDCSTDTTQDCAKKAIGNDDRFLFQPNGSRIGALHNIVIGIKTIGKETNDIIVLLDGDDFLFDNTVLEYLNNIYQDQNLWLTYGSYIELTDMNKINFLKNGGCNQRVTNTFRIRNEKINFSHLRTFRHFLWKRIDDNDLRGRNGEYFQVTWDVAMMNPMVEMAGLDRVKCVERVLYIYNNLNPLNDFKQHKQLQQETDDYLRSKPAYKILD